MLSRILEPEVMDSDADAREYDAMDHAAVNAQFVSDLLAAVGWVELHETHQSPSRGLVDRAGLDSPYGPLRILDLGTGTAQIPIELCRRAPRIAVTAVDAAESMLALARENVAAAGLDNRIDLIRADAQRLAAPRSASAAERALAFDAVVSNSIIHHIADPRTVLIAAVNATAPGGLLFHRDLARPNDEAQLEQLVATHAADATPYQRRLFADSLRAALTLNDMRELVADFGFCRETVQMTSDRHWTWAAAKV